MQWSQTRKPLAVNMTPLLSGTGGLIIQMKTGQASLQPGTQAADVCADQIDEAHHGGS
jgi:hypothetical protein